MRVGSLFAGIGGFDLAARNVGWRTAWVSEIHPYACKLLKQHFPDAPNHGDITKIDFTKVEPVEVLCGGFPCQDISTAGKGAGIEGARSGLWCHYARAIGELRPRYVVVENVAALLGRGLERVLGDLAALGYDAEWHCIPASYLGAPHIRDRVWIVASPNLPQNSIGAIGALFENYAVSGRDGRGAWWETVPPVSRMGDGLPGELDRLGGLGNAIFPQIAELLFRAIQDSEKD